MPKLDLTISLGNLLSIGVFVGGIYLAYGKLKERLVRIETQIEPLWGEYVDRRRVQRKLEAGE